MCWDNGEPEAFCGCVVGRKPGRMCPASAQRPQAAKKKEKKAVVVVPKRQWPDTSRDTRGCLACTWFFPDLKSGLALKNNADKRTFFITGGDALVQSLRGKCKSVEGLEGKHETECVTVLQKAAKNPPIAMCWDAKEPEDFCGCVVAQKRGRRCPASPQRST
mmetsp:Transcript_19430/g.61002  ORF Transcript_19430/g.61002 Transcript_19430/m.61002 type:complete len:162 (-) Transcript_19430:60-545(-)